MGDACKPESTIKTVVAPLCSGVVLLQEGLYKIDAIMRKEDYVEILKQRLQTSARKLKLGRKRVF